MHPQMQYLYECDALRVSIMDYLYLMRFGGG